MVRQGRKLRVGVWALLAWALPAGLAAAAGELYVKKARWPETMLAARARYTEWSAASPRKGAFRPYRSGSVRGDAPARKISVDLGSADVMSLAATILEGSGNLQIWGDPTLVAADGTRTPLTSLRPVSVKVGWGQMHVNRNWKNEPLQIGDRKFKQGFWVHADSEVCYKLDGKYRRFEAWIGMDAARATGTAEFRVSDRMPDVLPGLWRQIVADFPAEAKWLESDLGRGSFPAVWFRKAGETKWEQRLLADVLRKLGPADRPLRKELAVLADLGVAGSDRRWLDLYVKACRVRDGLAAIARIQRIDGPIAAGLRKELAALLGENVSPGEARWVGLIEKVGRIEKSLAALGPARNLNFAALAGSVEALLSAWPGRFEGGKALRARLDDCRRPWSRAMGALQRGEADTGKAVADLYGQIAAARRDLHLGLRGVSDYLAAHRAVDLEKEWEMQFVALRAAVPSPPGEQVHRADSLRHPGDRDGLDIVLRRTAALLADLQAARGPRAGELEAHQRELRELRAAAGRVDVQHTDARAALFFDACRIRRQVAFTNPLLNFSKLLFIKRHRSSFNHMCDQYYGINTPPGGGLFVLSGAFGSAPELRDVLAESVVQAGRLKGTKLLGGSFLSPDLSFDGKRILFAYVECTGDRGHHGHTETHKRGYWSRGRCYHVFRVNADGTHLVQVTDGTWNDFDPCWLPNGRVAFISERRGGYLRCGRTCPTYTLHDMADDGTDIRRLSPHETNEWHPSVTHEGLIIYTRWDYVDRHGCTAHLPWVTTLDGRDSRAVHGNFTPRGSRPDMELDVRAIPGSGKYVATAAPHHGQAFGSLVLIDPDVEDNDGMSPIKRITPHVGFPESQGGRQAYGTPWPLSEDYYLCVYDPVAATGKASGFQGSQDWKQFNYGIYLVDAFGNRVLVYRDPAIACLSPMPFRRRPEPVATPQLVEDGSFLPAPAKAVGAGRTRAPEATLAVMNVYDGLKPWPAGTSIRALRVIQVVPMSVPSGGPPHEVGLRLPSAGDSVMLARYVLGTVPVEADGSAHFRVPANVELYFQALDANGLAVQSMRSSTYTKPGERLVCQGCHDRRHRAPAPPKVVPLALRKRPRLLTPDVEGANPFSYPRLVQPVLDKRCVPCHTKNRPKAPNLAGRAAGSGRYAWYASYNSLARKYGFWNYGHSYRTTPGRFGARASKLYQMLAAGSHKKRVQLTAEEMHRIALWLDCCSIFYGVYERDLGQAQAAGKVVEPTLE
ncbi:MAG TPA: NPCBM/NEW2 domain-containing protein [Phycisphaerae bacterium]|nr:NPCBM/NEW2 domain-containing protein [Phycisphaerae bacterium]